VTLSSRTLHALTKLRHYPKEVSSDQVCHPRKKELDKLIRKSLFDAGYKLQEYLKAKDESQSPLQKHLRNIMLCNQAKAGDVHLLLAQIPFCGYCTTNYDTFIEDAYLRVYELHLATFDLTLIDNARQEYLVARNSKQAEQKFILKLLGDVYHPASLNLGDRYLKDWINKNTDSQEVEALEDIFLDSPILLIGFEPDEPDLKGLLANKTIFRSTPKPNQYIILVEGKPQQSLEEKKITSIWYESETELVSILEKIVRSLGIQPITEKKTKSDADAQQSPLQLEKNVRSTSHPETEPVHIFISWAPEDEIPKGSLVKQLRPLLDSRKISIWAGEELGIDRDLESTKHLNAARIFLSLISADFFASPNCQLESGMAIQRYNTEKASVEFGVEIAASTGKVSALLVQGSGKANLKITLEWEKPSPTTPPTTP